MPGRVTQSTSMRRSTHRRQTVGYGTNRAVTAKVGHPHLVFHGFPISSQLRNVQFNKRRRESRACYNYYYYISIYIPYTKASFKTSQLHYRCSQISHLARFREKKRQTVDLVFAGLKNEGLENILVVNFRLKS